MGGFLGACLIVAGFVIVSLMVKLPARMRVVFGRIGTALDILGDPMLSDDGKGAALRQVAIGLGGSFLVLLVGGGATLALPVGLIWLADRAGVLSFDATLAVSLSWRFILGSTLVLTLLAFMLGHARRAEAGDARPVTGGDYSGVERILHQVAFASRPLQILGSWLEDARRDLFA